MRKKLIAGNWKMYKTPAETMHFADSFLPLIADHTRDEIALFPSFVSLTYLVEACKGTNIQVGAQNMHWLDEGPFTGETSPTMIKHVGATHVLLGHSERRQYFAETDDTVNRKLKAALAHNLVPVICVGESLTEREANQTNEVLTRQVTVGFSEITAEASTPIVIAYEPVWAIGTGKTATPQIAEAAHIAIRKVVANLLGSDVANQMRILYGGSVKPDNAGALCCLPDIDGALVGGASLDPSGFAQIVQYSV